MSLTADQIVDRRRLRRKLSFWRVFAFVALAAAAVALFAFAGGREALFAPPQIARVSISGFITDDRDQLDLLDEVGKSDAVKGVIVAIDSPGGATAGGEALYTALLRLSAKKPTVATMSTLGASAAYMAAIATNHIVARRTTITGSIGVLFQFPQISELMKTLGVSVEEIKSAPLKAEPSMFKPPSDEAKAVIAGMINDTYNWFVDIVAERRGLSRSEALTLADGRVFTGRQALDAKLIDEIGGEETALAWLATKGVDAKLPIKDWEPKRTTGGYFSLNALALLLAREIGFGPEALRGGALDRFLPARLNLDGLTSVWQVPQGGDGEPARGAAR